MKILFFSHYFPPEVNAPANRTYEHCREWVAAGHEVHVITCVPSHPAGVPFSGYRPGWYSCEQRDGITVHRVWTVLAPNAGVLRRTVNFLSFIPTAVWRGLRLGTFDIIIGTSPQFFCAVATWIAASLKRTPWVFELRDLWPESIAAVGASRAYMPLRLLERLELMMYGRARAVVSVSRSFIRNLTERGVDESKIFYVPNGIEPAVWKAGCRPSGRAALGVGEHDIVVSYIGTVGMAHNLGTVLSAARLLQADEPRVKFAIVGEGAELPALRERARAERLTNVAFTGLVPRERIPDYLAATDISLVTLRPSAVFKTVLPSKMFESMAACRPILLAVEGEAKDTLERAGAGLPIAPGDPEAIASGVRLLSADAARRRAMGEAGQRFVDREFSRHAWAYRYLQILDRARVATTQVAVSASEPDTRPLR